MNNWCKAPSAHAAYQDYLEDVVLWPMGYDEFLIQWRKSYDLQ